MELSHRLGRYGSVLYRFARGIDQRPVRTDRVRKSLGSETTYASDLADMESIESEIERLAAGLARSLVKRELVARTVTLKVRYHDFQTITRSLSMVCGTHSEGDLLDAARRLLTRTEAGERPVRLLGLTASKLDSEGEDSQLRLF
jgi:DNA polymerase-4